MSHVHGAAGSVRQGRNTPGKRLGIKKYTGQVVLNGNIIVKQRGTVYHPGVNTMLSNDQSIMAIADGVVNFRMMSGFKRGKFYVDVIPQVKAKVKEA